MNILKAFAIYYQEHAHSNPMYHHIFERMIDDPEMNFSEEELMDDAFQSINDTEEN